MQNIKWTANRLPKSDDMFTREMSLENVAAARKLHESFPMYSVTPLIRLNSMSKNLGVGAIFVKDESYRFGMNAFKVLGGSYAIACCIADQLGRSIEEMTYDYLTSDELREEFGQATFFAATDGNHGRSVAWAARRLGQKCVIHMPRGTVKARFDNIVKEGAKVTIEDMNYDECVRLAAKEAAQTERGVIIQDTAWEGYTEIPTHILQGYGTMVSEALQQLDDELIGRPTHVFVQAGVGAFAGSVTGYLANAFPDNPPTTIVMETQVADCLYRGALAGDGEPRVVEGEHDTIMAGLACGEPNLIAWDILRNHANFFVSCPDWVAAKGMRMLAASIRGDKPVTSGESGAVGMGLLAVLMESDDYKELRQALKLDGDSRILMFSTEGDTDPENYRDIVWNGKIETVRKK